LAHNAALWRGLTLESPTPLKLFPSSLNQNEYQLLHFNTPVLVTVGHDIRMDLQVLPGVVPGFSSA
jgi:hypothetical protein